VALNLSQVRSCLPTFLPNLLYPPCGPPSSGRTLCSRTAPPALPVVSCRSDIVFLRAWVAVDLPRFYNPVTNLLAPAPPSATLTRKKPAKSREDPAGAPFLHYTCVCKTICTRTRTLLHTHTLRTNTHMDAQSHNLHASGPLGGKRTLRVHLHMYLYMTHVCAPLHARKTSVQAGYAHAHTYTHMRSHVPRIASICTLSDSARVPHKPIESTKRPHKHKQHDKHGRVLCGLRCGLRVHVPASWSFRLLELIAISTPRSCRWLA